MRITNNMITNNTKNNINGNKVNVDKYNTQMTTQKKISKASEDPVIAIRSLRLSTNLSHINQYVNNNIPDAEAWLDVTETALTNMKDLVSDIRTQCVNGSTGTLTSNDRQTILENLSALVDQIYTEGNSDYAGRTVFTGYRTTSNLTFDSDDTTTTYEIDQPFTYQDLEEHRYYSGDVEVPVNADAECDVDITQSNYRRLRLAYDGISDVSSFSYTKEDGTTVEPGFTIYDNEDDWAAATADGTKTVGDDAVVFIKNTGEFVLGSNVSYDIISNHSSLDVTYEKTGFDKGELRPEYYYDCRDISDPANVVSYTKEDQPINYMVANSTTLTVNTQASDVFNTYIQRDTNELINVVQDAINAEDKVSQIKSMMTLSQYADTESQQKLQTYLDAAQKEADYANDNLQKTYEQYITNFDDYLERINEGITNVGSMEKRLEMIQTRVENQQTTIKELKSTNEDRDISDIIIDYYAAYNAYQASLTAASKVGDQTLLNYL